MPALVPTHITFYNKEASVKDVIPIQIFLNNVPSDFAVYLKKNELSTDDIHSYSVSLKNYIEGLSHLYPIFPEDLLSKIIFDDASIQQKYNGVVQKISEAAKKSADISEVCDDLRILLEILIDENENENENQEHSATIDEAMVAIWEYEEALEAGLYMVSSDETRRIYRDIYDVIVNFINILDNAVAHEWTAKWSPPPPQPSQPQPSLGFLN